MVSQPENLRRGKASERRIGDKLNQFLPPAGPLLDLVAFGGRPLVVPEQRLANHLATLVEKNGAVHLAREADRLDVGRFELCHFDDGLNRRYAGSPPIFWVL